MFGVTNPADKKRVRIGMSEDQLQKNCVKWFRMQYQRFVFLLFHIPNGGKRDKIEAAIFKGMGVVAGVADLFLSIPNDTYHGCYFELKVGNNEQTQNQIMFMKWVTSMKYQYIVIRTIDEFIEAVDTYMSATPWYKPTWKAQKDQAKKSDLDSPNQGFYDQGL